MRLQGARVARRGDRADSERGASAVEFALVLSLLFILVFGIIQFGIAYNRTQGLQAAAREGARIAAVGGTELDVQTRVRQAQSLFAGSDVRVKIEYSMNNGGGWSGGNGGLICDDSTGNNQCTSNVAPTPCSAAGVGNLIRVTVTVPSSLTQYAIVIPLWGTAPINYESTGIFRCENLGG